MLRHTFIYHIDKPREWHKVMLKEKYHPSQILQLFAKKNKQIKHSNKYTDKDKVAKDEYIIIAIDSTSIKVTNRGRDAG
jgi:hypothetical protein